jgi:glycoprotein endo-alpha-1,2-mannosidase
LQPVSEQMAESQTPHPFQEQKGEEGDLKSLRQLPSRRTTPVSKRIDMAATIRSEDGTQLNSDDWMDEPDEERPRQDSRRRPVPMSIRTFSGPMHVFFSMLDDGDDDGIIEPNSDDYVLKLVDTLSLTLDESSEESPFEDDISSDNNSRERGMFGGSCICSCRALVLLFAAVCLGAAGIATGVILSPNNLGFAGIGSSPADEIMAPSTDDVPVPPPIDDADFGSDSTNADQDSDPNDGQTEGPFIETQPPDDPSSETSPTPPEDPQTDPPNQDNEDPPLPPDDQQDDNNGGGGGGGAPPFWNARDPNADAPGSFEFSPYLVGAYYYPWHKRNFHNNEGYIRKDLQLEPQYPALGEYDDSQPEVIAQHLAWSRQANIGMWATSWWGPDHVTDQTTRDVIMEHEDIGDLKIALHYETSGRLGRRDYNLSVADADMEYICERFFWHSTYYRVDGRPVMFLYLARALDRLDLLADVILTMKRAASRQCGEDLYVVGDHVFSDSPDPTAVYDSFMYLDAVTSYDIYGSMGRPSGYAGTDRVDEYYAQQADWRTVAHRSGCRYIPAVSPGFNDRGVRVAADHPALSRRITADAPEGSLFGYQIAKAKELVDPIIDNLLMVNSFNEWHEGMMCLLCRVCGASRHLLSANLSPYCVPHTDTQIEPVLGDPASEPAVLTQGLEYVGYDDLYLNLLRLGTVERRGNIFDQFDYGD